MAGNTSHNDNNHNGASSSATQGCTQANIALASEDLDFCIHRFLSDQVQRPPPGMKHAPSEAEAEAKMSVLLRALNAQLGNSPA